MEADKTINVTQKQSILRAKQLELLDRHTIMSSTGRGSDQKSDIVAGIGRHNLLSSDGAVNSLHLVLGRMLNQNSSSFSSLAVPH